MTDNVVAAVEQKEHGHQERLQLVVVVMFAVGYKESDEWLDGRHCNVVVYAVFFYDRKELQSDI